MVLTNIYGVTLLSENQSKCARSKLNEIMDLDKVLVMDVETWLSNSVTAWSGF